MAVMGYQEPGFNVTPWRQLIYGREMAYYGTFEKVPAMGWTLVPLSPYQGGSDSSFWPYDEKIMAYDFMIGMNMMCGFTGSYRGGNGLYQGEEYTQREIAAQLGISRSYVSRIEKSAIGKLRQYF